MIYFFTRDDEFTQCEIYPGPPHVFTVITPDGGQQTEQHECSDALHARWDDVSRRLIGQGWQGPFGRDTRI
jgi:hypothetical protein